MTMHVKDSGIWKTANPKVKDGGIWKSVQTGSVKDGGVWKTFFNNVTYSVSFSTTNINESAGTVTIYVSASVPVTTYLMYQIIGTGGWDTDDYNITGSSDNQKPSGALYLNNSSFTQFTLSTVLDQVTEGAESFYVIIKEGYYVYSNPEVATTYPTFVTVNNSTYCIWALYGRPEWC